MIQTLVPLSFIFMSSSFRWIHQCMKSITALLRENLEAGALMFYEQLKGTSGQKKSLAQMKEREKCKKTNHHRPRCTKWFSRYSISKLGIWAINKTNDLILNLTPENVTQHSRIVTTTRKGSSTPTKMSKIIGRQIHWNVKNRQNQYIDC